MNIRNLVFSYVSFSFYFVVFIQELFDQQPKNASRLISDYFVTQKNSVCVLRFMKALIFLCFADVLIWEFIKDV